MLRKINVAILCLVVGCVLTFGSLITVQATGNNPPVPLVSTIDSITLTATENSNEVSWIVSGENQAGVKVVFSKNEYPEYAPRPGDKYIYISDTRILRTELSPFDGAGNYYVRVCEYLQNSTCGTYSNQITINLDVESCEFDDVFDTNVHCQNLKRARNDGIVFQNRYFRPEDPVTRGEFAAMIVRAFEIPMDLSSEGFRDVPFDHTFYGQIMTLQAMGIIEGDNGNFLPDLEITRGASMKIINNAMLRVYPGLRFDVLYDSKLFNLETKFNDKNLNRHTFAQFIRQLYFRTKDLPEPIINGYYDHYLRPDNPISRIESVTIIIRSLKYTETV